MTPKRAVIESSGVALRDVAAPAEPAATVSAPADTVATRVDILDAFRGFAAMVVALFHGREILWVGLRDYWHTHALTISVASILAYLTLPLDWGAIGVPIFFVLSGYVIHRRAAQTLAKGKFEFATRKFLLRRFIRIYPTFVCAMCLTFICDAISRSLVPDFYKLGSDAPITFFLNLLTMQGVFSPTYGSNGPLWTLSIEIQFYAVYPLAILLWRRIGAVKMLWATLGVSLVGYLLLQRSGIVSFPQYYFTWWLGAFVADCEARSWELHKGLAIAGVAAIGVGCALRTLNAEFWAHVVWAVGFALLLGRVLDNRVARHNLAYTTTRFVGRFSYSLYSVHAPLFVLVSAFLFGGRKQEDILIVFVAMAGVLFAAYLYYLVAERPFIRVLDKMGH